MRASLGRTAGSKHVLDHFNPMPTLRCPDALASLGVFGPLFPMREGPLRLRLTYVIRLTAQLITGQGCRIIDLSSRATS